MNCAVLEETSVPESGKVPRERDEIVNDQDATGISWEIPGSTGGREGESRSGFRGKSSVDFGSDGVH